MGSIRKLPHLRSRITETDADIWVLTETNSVVDLIATHPYFASTEPVPNYHTPGEHWATVWSRYPARAIPTRDPSITAALEVETPSGPLLVYGTVLPYEADRLTSGAKVWSEHYRVVPAQGREWQEFRALYPNHFMCVAGDLNQSRDNRKWYGRYWYGTDHARKLLTDALSSANLVCVTDGDLVDGGKLESRSTIDHICLDESLARCIREVGAWEGRTEAVRLSDHNGVYVDIMLPANAIAERRLDAKT